MRRYVRLSTNFWIETRQWPPHARDLFLYCFTNDHAHGITGIGQIDDELIRFETKMTRRQLGGAWDWLTAGERPKVVRVGDWYWLVPRAKHTCIRENGEPHKRMVAGAWNKIQEPDMPREIRDKFRDTYQYLFDNLSIGSGQESTLRRDSDSDSDPDSDADVPHSRTFPRTRTQPEGKNRAKNPDKTALSEIIREEGTGEWDVGVVERIVKNTPREWGDALSARVRALLQYRPAEVMGHVLDLQYARKRPSNAEQAMEWLFSRLKHKKAPSDENYERGKAILRKGE